MLHLLTLHTRGGLSFFFIEISSPCNFVYFNKPEVVNPSEMIKRVCDQYQLIKIIKDELCTSF